MSVSGQPSPTVANSSSDVESPADDRLVPLLRDHMVPWEILHDRYGPLLQIVRALIGVVPNCDQYLEIWKPAFRTYNIMVPNFLNLPFSIFGIGGAPADVVGMGMYVSSRAAECPYCSAHTCSFALRRGAPAEKVAQALVGGDAPFTPGELATVAVARSLGRIPCELTASEREELERCFGPEKAEWVVLGIAMMGFLNKFMDTVGVELEASTVAEVTTTMGEDWSAGKAGRDLDPAMRLTPPPPADGLRSKLGVVPSLTGAIRLDRRWQQGVPSSWPEVGVYLREITGHEFPVLSRLHHDRAIKSVASMLRENLNPATTVVGLDVKVLAGIIFAECVADEALGTDVQALAPRQGVSPEQIESAKQFAVNLDARPTGSDPKVQAALILARAASPSPAEIDASIVAACREANLSAPAIVELVAWISVLQMLHRLSSYYVAGNDPGATSRERRVPEPSANVHNTNLRN